MSIEVVIHVAVRKNIAAAVAAYSALQWRRLSPKVQLTVVVVVAVAVVAAKTWPTHSMQPVVNQRVMVYRSSVMVVRILAAFVVPNVLIAPFGSSVVVSLMRNCGCRRSPLLDDTARPRHLCWRSVVGRQSQYCDDRSPHSAAAAAAGVGVMVPFWLLYRKRAHIYIIVCDVVFFRCLVA